VVERCQRVAECCEKGDSERLRAEIRRGGAVRVGRMRGALGFAQLLIFSFSHFNF
jgi:hypothetical protein